MIGAGWAGGCCDLRLLCLRREVEMTQTAPPDGVMREWTFGEARMTCGRNADGVGCVGRMRIDDPGGEPCDVEDRCGGHESPAIAG